MKLSDYDRQIERRPEKPRVLRSKLTPKVSERLVELFKVGSSVLPVWIRAPANGPEHYTGLCRPKLFQLAAEKRIRSVSICDPGKTKGCRLFHLASILEFIEKCESESESNHLN